MVEEPEDFPAPGNFFSGVKGQKKNPAPYGFGSSNLNYL